MMTGVAGAEEIKDSTLDCMATPATTAFPESHPHCLRRPIYLAFPLKSKPGVTSNFHRRMLCRLEPECGPMPNLMVALPNIGGALCSTPQSLADAHY